MTPAPFDEIMIGRSFAGVYGQQRERRPAEDAPFTLVLGTGTCLARPAAAVARRKVMWTESA
jgi:hypothetical protein